MTLRIMCLLIALATSIGGCTNTGSLYAEPTAQAILVQQKNHVLLLQSLRGAERQRLHDFITSASRGRLDAVHLDIIGSPRLGAQVASQARAIGVDAYNIRLYGPRIDQHDSFAVRVEAIIYEARPPVCPPLSIVGPSLNDNSFNQTLGCSTRNNLEVMVNDPRDLLANEAVRASNGDRAAIPIATYRTFARGDNSNLEHGTRDTVSSQPAPVGTTNEDPSR